MEVPVGEVHQVWMSVIQVWLVVQVEEVLHKEPEEMVAVVEVAVIQEVLEQMEQLV